MSSDDDEDARPGITRAKAVVLGATGVGKTQLIWAINGERDDDYKTADQLPKIGSTVGLEFSKTRWPIGSNRTFSLYLWDTAGQERFQNIMPNYMNGAEIVLLVFDLTDASSFEQLAKRWLKTINDHRMKVGMKNVVVYLIGNKTDLDDQRVVTRADAQRFAHQNDMKYGETSALHRSSIHAVLTDALIHVDALHRERGPLLGSTLALAKPAARKSCC